jgi:uncharacterized membrane protein YsdA (DUF1294 family)
MTKLILIYLLIVNALGFLLMLVDKRKAQKNLWRIPEATLFLMAAIGGSIGSLAGMYKFRHKTKHWQFVIGMPAILIAQIVLVFLLLR